MNSMKMTEFVWKESEDCWFDELKFYSFSSHIHKHVQISCIPFYVNQ